MAAPEMICRLMSARTAAHMAHLQTKSFATHKALDDFYSEVVGFIDSFAETYQGIFGLITKYPMCEVPQGNPVEWMTELRRWLVKDKDAACKGESCLENIHDEIVALIAQTLYKLRFLDNPALAAMGAKHEAEESFDVEEQEDTYLKMSKW